MSKVAGTSPAKPPKGWFLKLLQNLFRPWTRGEAGNTEITRLIKSVERNPLREVRYIELLQAYESKGDIDGASTYPTSLIDRKPNIENPYRYLLVAYNRKGDMVGLTQAVRLYSRFEMADQWFLVNAYTKGDWDAAIAILSTLVEIHPEDEKWSRWLVTAYNKKDNVELAVVGLAKLVELCPNNAVLRQHLEYYRNTSKLRDVKHSVPDSTTTKRATSIDWSFQPTGGRKKTDFEKNLEFKTKLLERDAKDREQKRIEHELGSKPRRPLTPWEKFKKIKPTGSRDGFGP